MRPLLLGILVACGHAPARPEPAPSHSASSGVAPALPAHGCRDAAHGIASATRGLRDPDTIVVEELTARCTADEWSAEARDCFSGMQEGGLDVCVKHLDGEQSGPLLEVLANRASLASAREKLAAITVGIAVCDDYVTAVEKALDCEALTVDVRAQLGTEAANFWSIPLKRLDEEGKQQVVDLCVRGLQQLQAAVQGVCVL